MSYKNANAQTVRDGGTALNRKVIILKDILLYSNQPVLAAGLHASLAGLPGFRLAAVGRTIQEVIEHIRATPASLILIDLTTEMTLEGLKQIHSEARRIPVVLWVESVSIEFAAQVIGMGVRGILRKTISLDLHVKCLQSVAAGELWLEKILTDQILSTRRVNLTQRERDLLGLLAQGLRNKEIAHQLKITEGTVKVYLSHLFRKVGVSDRLELALFALRNIVGPMAASEPKSLRPAELVDATPLFVPGFLSRPAA